MNGDNRLLKRGKRLKKKKSHSIKNRALYSIQPYFLSLVTFPHLLMGMRNIVTTLLFVASMLIGGLSLFKVGLQNLIHFDFDMKTLMTVAVIGGAIIGEWAEVSLVVILFAISEALERFSMDKARLN